MFAFVFPVNVLQNGVDVSLVRARSLTIKQIVCAFIDVVGSL
jgi:hypothetical protein